MLKIVDLYYSAENLSDAQHSYGSVSDFYNIYYDAALTKLAGYYHLNNNRNIKDLENIIFTINITIYINDKIFSYYYVKKNNNNVVTPLTFYNKWDATTYSSGFISRTFITNKIRKLVIHYP